jgi:hypothetical protein
VLPVLWAVLSVAAPELVKEAGRQGGRESAGFHSEVGGTQGFPPTPIFFCIALHRPHLHRPHLRAAEKRLKEHADWSVVRAQMDDAYLAGPVTALDEVEERLRAAGRSRRCRPAPRPGGLSGRLTYAEPAVRFNATHVRNAQGLEPWAWVASVQREGGVLSLSRSHRWTDWSRRRNEGGRVIGHAWPARAGCAGGGERVCVA